MLMAGVITPLPIMSDMLINDIIVMNAAALPDFRSGTRRISVHTIRDKTPMTFSAVGFRMRKIRVSVIWG